MTFSVGSWNAITAYIVFAGLTSYIALHHLLVWNSLLTSVTFSGRKESYMRIGITDLYFEFMAIIATSTSKAEVEIAQGMTGIISALLSCVEHFFTSIASQILTLRGENFSSCILSLFNLTRPIKD